MSTPIRFKYLGKDATVQLAGERVTITYDGQTMMGRYALKQVFLMKAHPIGVEAAAALRKGELPESGRDITPEARVRAEVREAIGAMPDVYMMDNPVGHAEFYDLDSNKSRHVDYGLEEGSPDLIVALKTTIGALMVGLELKAPGKFPRKNQSDCHRRWRAAGIHVVTIQSGQEAVLALERVRIMIRGVTVS